MTRGAAIAVGVSLCALAASVPVEPINMRTDLSATEASMGDACGDKYANETACKADSGCEWCKCAALPSACWTTANAKKLPSGVYDCSGGGGGGGGGAEIVDLPGIPSGVNFKMFSGYINVSSTRALFYWFVESQSNPSTDPVLLWTNGGPGCSGLGGFLSEQGPFRATAEHTLTLNKYAWNQLANMIFIEQPAGVGFSTIDDPTFAYGDATAAADNAVFIAKWREAYPAYANNDFYLSSESYGGHYLPTLAQKLLTNKADETFNFKGFMVGNPLTYMPYRNYGEFATYAGHSLLPAPAWDQYVEHKCWTLGSDQPTPDEDICEVLTKSFSDMTQGIDHYALDFPVCASDQAVGRQERHALVDLMAKSSTWPHSNATLKGYFPDGYEPCAMDYLAEYLNLPAVQKAIHIQGTVKWGMCANVDYNSKDVDAPMMPVYEDLLAKAKDIEGFKVMVYSGDDDAVCASLGSQKWIWDMAGFNISNNWAAYDVDGQQAGYTVDFSPTDKGSAVGFRFTTVHGAGHMVPQTRPAQSLEVVRKFLHNDW